MIIGIGIDLVEVKRLRKALKHPKNRGGVTPPKCKGGVTPPKGEVTSPLLKRVFTPREISYAQSRGRTKDEHLAARFAAKEAFLKAIQTGWGTKNSPFWQEIEVRTRAHGQPYLVLSGKARTICNQLKVKKTHLSLTHTKDHALAIVILER